MSAQPILTEIGPKMRLLRVKCPNTKTTCLSIVLKMPLLKNTAEYFVLSSFLSHTSKAYPSLSRLNARLEELYGAVLYAGATKLGESYCLRFSLTCLKDALALDGERLSQSALELLLDLILNPLAEDGKFNEKQFETELRIAIEDIESTLNDKRAYALGRMVETMCKDEAYGISKETLLKEVKKVTPESLFLAWQELLSEAIVSITVVGEQDFDNLKSLLESRFGALSDRHPVEIKTVYKNTVEEVKALSEDMDVNQSKLVLGFRTDMQNKKDRYFAHRIMTDMFGGGPYSKLFLEVREKKSLCYYCAARLDRLKGLLIVQSGIEKKNKEAAQKEILLQLQKMQAGDFSDEDLAASKAALCDAFRGIEDTAEGIDAFYAYKLDDTVETPKDIVDGLSRVTREDVIAAAKGVKLDTVYFLAGKEEV